MVKDLVTRWPVIRQLLTRSDGTGLEAASERTRNLAPTHRGAQVARSVCPYCAVGCGELVWWDEAKKKWTGLDVPDFSAKSPDYRPQAGATGDAALAGDRPFILHSDGLGWIWARVGLADGPLPTHYEPLESPLRNPLYTQQTNPAAISEERPDNQYAVSPDTRFPYVMTTYRLTEHHTSGAMSRTLSDLAELQPYPFCEISDQLAAERGISNGEWVKITSTRGIIEARALVTSRTQALDVGGNRLQQVGVPYHWGYRGLVKGDIANDLTAISE
jgi:formate dehydrogenase major subunit